MAVSVFIKSTEVYEIKCDDIRLSELVNYLIDDIESLVNIVPNKAFDSPPTQFFGYGVFDDDILGKVVFDIETGQASFFEPVYEILREFHICAQEYPMFGVKDSL